MELLMTNEVIHKNICYIVLDFPLTLTGVLKKWFLGSAKACFRDFLTFECPYVSTT